MNTTTNINTLSLLNSQCDAIHIIYHNVFRLLKPIRRNHKLTVNECIILNAVYLYHKYKGSLMSCNAIYNWITYYNKNRLNYYIASLCFKGHLIKSDVVKNIQYYKLTDSGISIMEEFNSSYQSILYSFCSSHSIEL